MSRSNNNVLHSIKHDGGRIIIHKMYDIDGDETDDPEMAFSVTAQMGNSWLRIEVGRDSDIQVV